MEPAHSIAPRAEPRADHAEPEGRLVPSDPRLAAAIARVREDAREDAPAYLRDARVPEGGE